MGWSARQWLALTPETSFGVYNTSGTPIWIRLSDGNAFTMRPRPLASTIRSADGGNRRRQRVAARAFASGTLETLFYPSQAQALLGWATSLANYTPQSYTIDHWDSVRPRRYLGCLVKSLAIGSSASRNDGVVGLSFEIVAQQPASPDPVLNEPASSSFPAETPYTHQQSAGLATIGTSRSKYRSLDVVIRNLLVPTWDETQYPSALYWTGRDVDWSIWLQYLAATDRASFESQAPLACSVGWSQAATGHSVTLNFQGTNYLDQLVDDLPLDGAGYQHLILQSFFDNTAQTDLTATVV